MGELMVPAVLVPHEPGTLSALGLLTTDVRRDYVRTFLRAAAAVAGHETAELIAALEDRGRRDLLDDGLPADAVAFERAVDMRYVGQAYEVTVPIDDASQVEDMAQRFHAEHERLYAHRLPEAAVEMTALRVAAVGRLPGAAARALGRGNSAPPSAAEKPGRRVFFDEAAGWVACPIYERSGLLAGNRIAGPAIIEQMDTTTVVFPGQTAVVEPSGIIEITRGGR